MLDPAVLPGFLTAVVLVTLAPGPDNTYIAAVALARGARAGVLSAAGMSAGMLVHVSAAALGLAVLMRSSPWVLTAVQIGGAAYLGWLAVTTFRAIRHSAPTGAAPQDRQVLGRAVMTNLTNPKVIIFFAAFLPQFTRSGHGPLAVQLLTLGLIFLLIGLICDSAIGLAVGRLGRSLAPDGRGAAVLTGVAGLTFATLAVLLVAEVLLHR
jgi:threonine/homoserine/homoserine lactone efflux protein